MRGVVLSTFGIFVLNMCEETFVYGKIDKLKQRRR